nr:hypothetical protein [Tanacetum cinerariifolium]
MVTENQTHPFSAAGGGTTAGEMSSGGGWWRSCRWVDCGVAAAAKAVVVSGGGGFVGVWPEVARGGAESRKGRGGDMLVYKNEDEP